MKPSLAMGLFLQTWRTDWAKLSREQVAGAVSRAGGKPVKSGTVREWESGQPPARTEDLDGLLQVMRRHGIPELWATQFREAVFTACVDRHYDGLFPEENLAQRTDVADLAAALGDPQRDGPQGASMVALLAAHCELEAAVVGADGPPVSSQQRRRQVAALVHLKAGISFRLLQCGRMAAAARLFCGNEELLRRYYGLPGIGPGLRVLDQRLWGIRVAASAENRPGAILRLLDEIGEWEHIWPGFGAVIHFTGLQWATQRDLPDQRQSLLACSDRYLDTWRRLDYAAGVAGGHMEISCAHLADGNLTLAERSLEAAAPQFTERPFGRAVLWRLQGGLALANGRYDEARRLVRPALALAREWGYLEEELMCQGLLQQCDQAEAAARNRGRARVVYQRRAAPS
jgi:hypothetical protein